MTRTTIYVDGLKLYYNALKGTDYTWLDLAAFGKKLISANDQLATVKYFTAQISSIASEDKGAPNRHRVLIRALKATASSSGGCRHLLTEDLQDGQVLEGLNVVNPFMHEPDLHL